MLDGCDGIFQEHVFPLGEVGFGPVSIDPAYGRIPVFGDFLHHFLDVCGWYVVTVY